MHKVHSKELKNAYWDPISPLNRTHKHCLKEAVEARPFRQIIQSLSRPSPTPHEPLIGQAQRPHA